MHLHTLQDGEYTIDLDLLAEIRWDSEEEATVSLTTGNAYTFEDEDLEALKRFVAEKQQKQ